MRILQIANGYVENKLYSLLFSALEQQGAKQTVFVPVNEKKPGSSVGNVHIVPCFDQLDRALFFRKQKKMLRWLEGNLDISKFDCIHAHTVFSGGYAAYKLHQKYGIPYIVAVRNTDVNLFFRYMLHLRKTGVEILKNAEKVIFLSPSYREKVLSDCIPLKELEAIANKTAVVPNGIARLFFDQNAAPKTLGNQLRLAYVGDINTNKNVELTVQAADILRSQGHDVTLTAIGTIKEDKYREILNKDWITHHDRCPQEQVIEYLKDADIFLMPSHRETFGLVYAEAMSQGLPVLYTAGQGFDGHFPEGEVGFSVSDTDARDIGEKILKITENYEILSKNAIAHARRFDWNAIAQVYGRIYQEIQP